MQQENTHGSGLNTYFARVLLQTQVLLMLTVFATTGMTATESMDQTKMDRLKRGEVLVETVHEEKSGGAARVTALFYTNAETVWNVIGYCKYEFIYVRGLESCGVLIPGLQFTRKQHRVNNNWYTPTIEFVFDATRTSATHGEFRLVEGDLNALEGHWDFQPAADGDAIIVTHEIRLKPRIPAPRWLVRRVLKKDLPDMVACVRGLARASGDKRLLTDDLGRCPGDTSQVAK